MGAGGKAKSIKMSRKKRLAHNINAPFAVILPDAKGLSIFAG